MLNIEFAILDFIQSNFRCTVLDFIMPKITLLGSCGFIWILVAIIFLVSKKYRKNGIILAITLLLCLLICNLILKNWVGRDRPCWINTNIDMLIAIPKDYSFPSGHSFSSFASALVIFYANKKIGICAYILAFLIAFSRLYLYVHFSTDILFGIVMGTFMAFLVVKLSEMVINKFSQKNSKNNIIK